MWTVELLDERVVRELEALPTDMRAHFLRISRLIALHGLQNIHEPYVKHLEGRLWEIRMKGRDGIARAAYVTTKNQHVIVVHIFRRKTQKTDRRDIEIALRRTKGL